MSHKQNIQQVFTLEKSNCKIRAELEHVEENLHNLHIGKNAFYGIFHGEFQDILSQNSREIDQLNNEIVKLNNKIQDNKARRDVLQEQTIEPSMNSIVTSKGTKWVDKLSLYLLYVLFIVLLYKFVVVFGNRLWHKK